MSSSENEETLETTKKRRIVPICRTHIQIYIGKKKNKYLHLNRERIKKKEIYYQLLRQMFKKTCVSFSF